MRIRPLLLLLQLLALSALAGCPRAALGWGAAGKKWVDKMDSKDAWKFSKWRHTFRRDWTPGKDVPKGTGALETACDCVAQRGSLVTGAFRNSMCTLPRNFEFESRRNKLADGTTAFFKASLAAKIVGRPDDMRLVSVRHAAFSCVDGRDPVDDRALRTPGGDAAEFVYMLHAWDKHVKTVYQSLVDKLLYKWLVYGGRKAFTLETDEEAVDGIARKLTASGDFFKEDILDLTTPPGDLQKTLREELQRPSNQGNAHLRLMMKHPKEYGVKAEIVQMVISSFFTLLWNKDTEVLEAFDVGTRTATRKMQLHRRLKLVVRSGKRREGAWINVSNIPGCEAEGVASLFAPHHDFYPRRYHDLRDAGLAERAVARADLAAKAAAGGEDAAPEAQDVPGGEADDPARDPTLPRPRQVMVFHAGAVNTLRKQLSEFMRDSGNVAVPTAVALKEIQRVGRHAAALTRLFSTRAVPEYDLRVL